MLAVKQDEKGVQAVLLDTRERLMKVMMTVLEPSLLPFLDVPEFGVKTKKKHLHRKQTGDKNLTQKNLPSY